ncbi:dermatopontin-like [Oculina patagonica]
MVTMADMKIALLVLLIMITVTPITPLCDSFQPPGIPWQNTWHQSFNSSCPPGHQLSQWETYFRKCQGDRIHFFYECRPGPASGNYEQDCSWTDYLNSPTQYFFSTCPNNGYVAGQVSTFDPAASDRRTPQQLSRM